ncbi:Uracil phosphoribosyltransferase [Fragilaria crotonensis]|nr:Uracil phosphoribosyltransferase [Fragilaria crotonensis]
MCTTTGEVDQPLRDLGPSVQVSKHPVLSHKITVLRSSQTKPSSFRAVLKEITYHLGYEATSTLKTKPVAISVPTDDDHSHVECTGQKLAERVALVPILRSGLGMTESMLELLPNAGVHHIGMYKKKGQMPVQYYNRLPRDCQADVAYVLDPVIASATTVMSVVGILKKWGVPSIHIISVVASQSGLVELMTRHPDIHVTVGVVDATLTEDGVVLPGLGDAGDRLFGTPMMDDDDSLVHPSKRRRAEDVDE